MRKNRFLSLLSGGAVLIGLVLLADAPLSPSIVSDVPAPPSAGELDFVEELERWRASEPRFRLFGGALESPAPQRFTLFATPSPTALRNRLLVSFPYGDLIAEAADQYRLDGLLLAAVVEAESGFDPRAVSPRGAQGLMQLMPATAADVGLQHPHDPRANVRAGARYLRDQLRRFDDDLVLALAAYNAGPGNVLRYRGVPPFRETRTYVKRVMANYLRLHHELWLEAGEGRPRG